MKNLKITAPEGYEIDKENSTFENIVFKPIEKSLPKTWEELGHVSGHFVLNRAFVSESIIKASTLGENKNLFATEEQAEAALALAQLSQLREVYRDGWRPNWRDASQRKYIIEFFANEINSDYYFSRDEFFSFQSAEVRDMFLENFRDLIEQAKPLMS
jgi:hypothetical protein